MPFPCLKTLLLLLIGQRQKLKNECQLKSWKNVHISNPKNTLALRLRLRQLRVAQRLGEMRDLIGSFVEGLPETVETRLLEADLLNDAGLLDDSQAIYLAILAAEPDMVEPRAALVRQLLGRGRINSAVQLADGLQAGNEAMRKLAEDVAQIYAATRYFAPQALTTGADVRPAIAAEAFRRFRKRVPRAMESHRLGPVIMINGSLGPGGAERQFSLLARDLHGRIGQGLPGRAEANFNGPVQVLSLARLNGENGFFLPTLEEAGLEVAEVDGLERARALDCPELGPYFDTLLPMLPSQLQAVTKRLVPWLKARRPDVMVIWQDDTIVFSALAALIAGVPRIQLCFRGQSPKARKIGAADDYVARFQALAEVPGVDFITNALSNAETYADWLGISVDRFKIVPNGVEPPRNSPTLEEAEAWAVFDSATAGAGRTIGTVGRLYPGKRMSDWLDFARAYLCRHPDARFVIAGSGPQEDLLRAKAVELGIAPRVLFTGLTKNVGYWLDRMDIFLMLSESEGMPNVLLEAQMAGVGVVSTPAGAATTCYVEGLTGLTLPDVDRIDIFQVMDLVDRLIDHRRTIEAFDADARAHAAGFSVSRMGTRYLSAMMGSAGGVPHLPKVQDLQ